eukprot:360838-Chlamydomonas_euryale.AAC.9
MFCLSAKLQYSSPSFKHSRSASVSNAAQALFRLSHGLDGLCSNVSVHIQSEAGNRDLWTESCTPLPRSLPKADALPLLQRARCARTCAVLLRRLGKQRCTACIKVNTTALDLKMSVRFYVQERQHGGVGDDWKSMKLLT